MQWRRRRTAALLLLSVAGLFLVGAGLSLRLLRAGLSATSLSTEQRLQAIGLTAAAALGQGASPAVLTRVARDNDLEAAYLLDEALRPLTTGASALTVSLLRLDPDRALRALRGQATVGFAYRLDDSGDGLLPPGERAGAATVLGGYFPVRLPGQSAPLLLVLEAGAAFSLVPTQLRATAWAAGATALGLALLCVVLIAAALRAGGREQQLLAEAERGELLRQMAAMVAHELRNPLGTIRAGTELLREQAADRGLCDDILAETARLNELTTQFLLLARDPPLSVHEVDLGALCADLCRALRRQFPDATALQIEQDGAESVSILGDGDKLRQVLLNLALNAIQAMQARGRLRFTVRRTDGGGAELAVQDSGPGISPEVERSLFEPFATSKKSGCGLGLTLSRRIVEKHGGTLTASPPPTGASAAPPGTTFLIQLPARPPAASCRGEASK